MSGILNSKERVFDVILTTEGRRQMAAGTFAVRYASFTDSEISYRKDDVEGHVDPTSTVYFEANNLPQDQIVFEANDAGQLVPFKESITVDVNKNKHHPTSKVAANLTGGKLTTFEFHHGRSLTTKRIHGNIVSLSSNSGFYYSDYNGVTGSIRVNKNLTSGEIAYTTPAFGAPYKAFIGTKDGIPAELFATRIQEVIEKIKNDGGPSVNSLVKENRVYLDVGDSLFGNRLRKIENSSNYNPLNGQNGILNLKETAIGGTLLSTELTDSEFAGQIKNIFNTSFDNFVNLQTIATIDELYGNSFDLSKNEIDLDLNKIDDGQYTTLQSIKPTLDTVDSLFADKKLSHIKNFKYLPPILKPNGRLTPQPETIARFSGTSGQPNIQNAALLGNYVPFGNNRKMLSIGEIKAELSKSPKEIINFEKTSRNNNVICQFFEVAGDKVNKLDVIERVGISNKDTDEEKNYKIFFVGKTYLDSRGTHCFVNMFTLAFNLSDDRTVE